MHSSSCQVRIAIVAAIGALAVACGGSDETTAPRFVEREVVRSVDDCAPGSPDCAWVKLRWLDAEDGADAARTAIDDWIVTRILDPLGDDWVVNAPEDVAEALLDDRAAFVAEFPDASTAGWYLEREIRRLPAPDGMVSLEFTERMFTGGAHGMESIRLVTFRTSDGALLGLDELVPPADRAAFLDAIEATFRATRGLGPDQDLADAGFFIEGNRLPPTDNVARVHEGLRLRYDAYEIAPYAMGATDLTVPM